MDLKHYFAFLGRWLWVIVLAALLAGVVAGLITQQIRPRYAAATTLIISGRSAANALTPEMMRSLTVAYVDLAKQPSVLATVIEELDLPTTPADLAKQVNVTLVPESLLIRLTANNADPHYAAGIANALAAVLRGQGVSRLGIESLSSRFTLHVVEPAVPAARPVAPWLLLNIAVGVAFGAMAALGVGLLSEYFDDRIKNSARLTSTTGLASLAVITRIRNAGGSGALIALNKPESPVSEEYRLLRTHIAAANDRHSLRTILVSSSLPGEGKSLTGANLAVVMARAGTRVILVDANLRHPRLHALFGCSADIGLAKALAMEPAAAIASQLQDSGVENLRLLASGPAVAGAVELLAAPAMGHLLEALAAQADVLIVDSPALLATADATILARHCDATLLVVQAGKTSAAAVRAACYRLEQFGIDILGAVLNRARQDSYSGYAGSLPQPIGNHSRRSTAASMRPADAQVAAVAKQNGHLAAADVNGKAAAQGEQFLWRSDAE